MKKIFTLLIVLTAVPGYSQSSVGLYQYWFNGDIEEAVTVTSAGTQSEFNLSLAVPVEGLPDGLHAFHIRFRDQEKIWSSTLSRFFYKVPLRESAENRMKQFQYWFNNDVDNPVTGTTDGGGLVQMDESVSVSGLPDGLHAFHIRFRDENGGWSSTLSRFFYKMPVSEPVEENLIVAYRYWFNDNDDDITSVDLDQPVNPLHLAADIEPPVLGPGVHNIHIKFLDLKKYWSSVFTGEFEAGDCSPGYIGDPEGDAEVCVGTTVFYNVDAATGITGFDWWVTPSEAGIVSGNGSSAKVEWSASFTGDAEISVRGSGPCGETEVRSTGVVVVATSPELSVMDDVAVCEGDEVVLTAQTDGTLYWSGGEDVVSPLETTVYTASSVNACGQVEEDVTITVHPYPEVPVLEQVDDTLVSSSGSGNIWYFNDTELEGISGQQYSPGSGGDYFVRVISEEGCLSEPSNIITFLPSNLIKIGVSEIIVFPNPVSDRLFISPRLLNGEPFRVELITLGGRVLILRNIVNESYINVEGLSPSVYILRISRGDESRTLRIIKN